MMHEDNKINIKFLIKTVQRTLSLVYKQKRIYVLLFFGLSLINAILPFVSLIITQTLINFLQSGINNLNLLIYLFILFSLVSIISTIITNIYNYVGVKLNQFLYYKLNTMLIEKTKYLTLKDYENNETYDLLQRAEQEVGVRPFQIITTVASILSSLISVISSIIILYTWHSWTLFGFIILPFLAFKYFIRINENEYKVLFNRTQYERESWYVSHLLTKDEYNSSIHTAEMNPNNNPYVILDTTEMKTLVGIKYTAPTTKSGFIFKSTSIADNALKKYKIEVSKDGASWTTVKEGTLNLDPQNPTETIYFDAEGVTGGNQLSSYNARYVKITALDTKNFAASELDLITPPGDNIEIGLSDDNITYTNGIGVLKNDYEYQADNPDTNENERKFIPAGSVIITGEYRGNPAFNVPLVLNEKEQHIADKYQGILLAQVPDNGNLEEVAEGTWIYWVNPEDATKFKEDNKKIFAELYRTDAADALEGGQRLVSDTFKIDVPKELPEITLSASSRSVNEVKAIDIKTDILNAIKENR